MSNTLVLPAVMFGFDIVANVPTQTTHTQSNTEPAVQSFHFINYFILFKTINFESIETTDWHDIFRLVIGPLSVDRYPEVDDDVDVDVERCSDSEAAARAQRTSQSSLASPTCPSDEDRLTPEPAQVCTDRLSPVECVILMDLPKKFFQSRSGLTNSCNCEDLNPIQCHLETKELWDKFHDLGTEMIITKTGR